MVCLPDLSAAFDTINHNISHCGLVSEQQAVEGAAVVHGD